jgi:hypothetical protein
VTGQDDLFEIVGTLGACGCFAHFLHGRQQQANEDGDDGNDHQQFDQRETASRGSVENASQRHGGTPPKDKRMTIRPTKSEVEKRFLQKRFSG